MFESMLGQNNNPPPNGIRPLMRSEYDQLVELGVFEDEKIELLRGMLVTMSPEGWQHTEVGHWLFRRLVRALGDEFEVRLAAPFAASDDSEPEPDLFVGRTPQDKRRAHPGHALLLVEVSDSSIRKDRKIKKELYAEVGVPEYWIIDITNGVPVVEVYTEPSSNGYGKLVTLRDGDILRPVSIPIEIAVADLPR
jgi:Uma2 family endonuclease